MSASIVEAITALARQKLDWTGAPLTSEMRLVEDLALDSLRLMTLAMEVEDHFRICLDEDDEEAIETVGDLASIIARKLAAREADGPG